MGGEHRFVVGTAGHIDHGKTALVRALTGVDTDRWEEEKRRGITIDLGFAPLDLGGGVIASVVDVPGHEGFVRNMLAGATGIDVALLVVAADEGVMPQTEEHLAIVELLGVARGIPVITKADLVDEEWLGLVRAEVAGRLAASPLRWEAPVVTSVMTGVGLDDLREALRSSATSAARRDESDLFRLPIDRVFALPGAGTIVTGTVWSGGVTGGESVHLLPLDRTVRIRSIQVHGAGAERAGPGRRAALALVGVDRSELARGHVATTGPGWRSTGVLDVSVQVLPSVARPVAPRSRVRVHLGTAEVLARVTQSAPIRPGDRGVARLMLETPLVARGGDRFVLRSFSPVTTIGGGVVLDPFPAPESRLPARRLGPSQTLPERLASWVEETGLKGLKEADIPVRLGIRPGDVAEVAAATGKTLLRTPGWLVARSRVNAEVERLHGLLTAHHEAHPLDSGLSLQGLRAAVGPGVPESIQDLILEQGRRKLVFEVDGAIVRSPGWRPAVERGVGTPGQRLLDRIEMAGWEVPTVAELERDLPDLQVRPLLAHLLREGGVEQVDRERVAAPAALRRFEQALATALAELGAATPAQLKGRFGLTRKHLIPLLEWADRRGMTRREGDARVPGRLTGRSEAS